MVDAMIQEQEEEDIADIKTLEDWVNMQCQRIDIIKDDERSSGVDMSEGIARIGDIVERRLNEASEQIDEMIIVECSTSIILGKLAQLRDAYDAWETNGI